MDITEQYYKWERRLRYMVLRHFTVQMLEWRNAWKWLIWGPLIRFLHPIVRVDVGDRQLYIDVRDKIMARLLYLYGLYEVEVEQLMKQMDLPGAVCLDIGANIGLHTVAMSALAGDEGAVYAFEPEARNFQLLQRNVQINGARNVITSQCAVGDHEGICRLALNPENFGDHRVAADGAAPDAFQEVPLVTIDHVLRDLPDGVVKLIKIDVQGYECHVMDGMKATLQRNPDLILLIEVFPDALAGAGRSATELMSTLRDLGFTGWEFNDFRVAPVSAPWVYELIRGKDLNLILSQNTERLNTVISRLYGRPVPPG